MTCYKNRSTTVVVCSIMLVIAVIFVLCVSTFGVHLKDTPAGALSADIISSYPIKRLRLVHTVCFIMLCKLKKL